MANLKYWDTATSSWKIVAIGELGATGPIGLTGATGGTGPQGTAGTAGAAGAVGATGPTGLTGATGATGLQGTAGTAGAAGAVGATGPTGLTGATGATGATGDIGPAGPTGTSYQFGDPIRVYVRNPGGGGSTTLTKGTIVYTSGANGDHIQVSRALASSDSTSARTLGYVEADIAPGADGYVIVEGYITGLNTLGTTSGDIVYLSPTTPGGWTTTKPYAPNHLVYVGVITRVNVSNGSIYVKIQNGYELDEIHDVLITSPQVGQVLTYSVTGSTGLWINGPTPTGPTGPTGLQGNAGANGSVGATGATGPTGPQGTAGTSGSAGATGPTGNTGPQGTAGTNGSAGPTGPSFLTTKGDLVAYTTTTTRKAVGTNQNVLISDSTQTDGLKWVYPQHILPLAVWNGALTVSTDVYRWFNNTGRTMTIKAVWISVGTAPTGSNILVDVNINGTTIFTTQANRPVIAATGFYSVRTTNMNITALTDGSYLTFDIDQIGSTVAGSNLIVTVEFDGA